MNIIVTGGLSGIGLEITKKYLENGDNVLATFVHDRPSLIELKETLNNEYTGDLEIKKMNLTSDAEIIEVYDFFIDKFEHCDILINNGGITDDMLVMKMKKENFTNVIETNLTGAFLVSKAFLKTMSKKRNGVIINVSSVVGIVGNAGQANYAASKAGLIGLTKSLSKEYGRRGIRVNAVAPGFIETNMTENLSDEIKENVKKNVSLGKLGTPLDVANGVFFLTSENAKYITGQTLIIDGGMI